MLRLSCSKVSICNKEMSLQRGTSTSNKTVMLSKRQTNEIVQKPDLRNWNSNTKQIMNDHIIYNFEWKMLDMIIYYISIYYSTTYIRIKDQFVLQIFIRQIYSYYTYNIYIAYQLYIYALIIYTLIYYIYDVYII